jgi:hypothetical protein
MLVRKNIVGDGNMDGIPNFSKIDTRIEFAYVNPLKHTEFVIGSAPIGIILPIIIANTRCDNITSNIVNKRTLYDLHILIIASTATPRTKLSGSIRILSDIIVNTVVTSESYNSTMLRGIRPIYHNYIKQWGFLRIIEPSLHEYHMPSGAPPHQIAQHLSSI